MPARACGYGGNGRDPWCRAARRGRTPRKRRARRTPVSPWSPAASRTACPCRPGRGSGCRTGQSRSGTATPPPPACSAAPAPRSAPRSAASRRRRAGGAGTRSPGPRRPPPRRKRSRRTGAAAGSRGTTRPWLSIVRRAAGSWVTWIKPEPICRTAAGPGTMGVSSDRNRDTAATMTIQRMTDLDLSGKRVLIRQDLNVPVDNGKVTSDQRLTASLPAWRTALDAGAAVMVMSHLGRPKEGSWSEEDSLAPVARRLGELLGRDVPLVRDYLDGVEVQPGQLVLLENCRMNSGEKADDDALSRKYAALCDVFVMDAFGTAHRAQASTHGVIRAAKTACGGPLLMAELDALAKALDNPARPLLAIVA